jgi:hypothetical protein
MQSLLDLFNESDADHDDYLNENDLIAMFRKRNERFQSGKKAILVPTISENVYV